MADSRHSQRRLERALEALEQIADPLRRLDAVRRSRATLDQVEVAAILQARAAGATWKQIGALYGLSKQGAQQRFRRSADHWSTA